MARYDVVVVDQCDKCSHTEYMVHDTVTDCDGEATSWWNKEAAEEACETANHYHEAAMRSPAVTELILAAQAYMHQGSRQRLEAAIADVEKERQS